MRILLAAGILTLVMGQVAMALDGPPEAQENSPPAPPPGHGHHHMFHEMDKNGDGVISKKEFDAFNNAKFKEIDTNNDGKISKEEMKEHHHKFKGMVKKEDDVQKPN